MEKSEIEAKIIKTYKLPLIDRIALHYNTFKYFLLAVIVFIPLITVLAVNSFHWQWFLYLSPLEILMIYILIRSILFLRDNGKYKKWGNSIKHSPDHASMFGGPPGTGKSLSAGHTVNWMQKGSSI